MSTPQKSTDTPLLPTESPTWDDERLRELHVERGWPATDISQEIGADPGDVRDRLKELDIFEGQTHPPKFGLARKVWEADSEAALEDISDDSTEAVDE